MSTIKDTLKHAIVYSGASIAAKIISFVLLPVWAYYMQVEGYGIIGMIDATFSFLMVLLGYGIGGGLTRFYHEEKCERDKKKVISTGVILIWIASGSFSIFMMTISPLISYIIIGDSTNYKIICFSFAAFVFDIGGQTASSYLIIRQKSSLFSILGVLRLFVQLFLDIYFIAILAMGVEGYFLASLITAFFFSVILNIIVLRQCGLAIDRAIASKIIKFEWPLIPGNILVFISRQTERIILRYMINLESVGIYEMGCKFSSILQVVIAEPIMQAWHTKRTEIAVQEDASEQLGKMFTFFVFIYVFAGLILFVNIREIITVMLPREFWPSYVIARIEILTNFSAACYYHLFFGLYYTKNTGKISQIKAVTSIAKIPISFFLILQFGLNGAAYAACLTTFIMMCWSAFLSQVLFPIKIEWKKIITILVAAFFLALFLTNIESGSIEFIQKINLTVIHRFINLLDFDFLHTWKSGLVLTKLNENSELFILILFKTLVCLSFVVLLPLVHKSSRERLYRGFSGLLEPIRKV